MPGIWISSKDHIVHLLQLLVPRELSSLLHYQFCLSLASVILPRTSSQVLVRGFELSLYQISLGNLLLCIVLVQLFHLA